MIQWCLWLLVAASYMQLYIKRKYFFFFNLQDDGSCASTTYNKSTQYRWQTKTARFDTWAPQHLSTQHYVATMRETGLLSLRQIFTFNSPAFEVNEATDATANTNRDDKTLKTGSVNSTKRFLQERLAALLPQLALTHCDVLTVFSN